MITNPTINSVAYVTQYNDAAGSKHRNVTRGVNLPDDLVIRHSDTVNKTTGLSERRSDFRLLRTVDTGSQDGTTCVVQLALTAVIPQVAGVESADLSAMLASLADAMDSGGADLVTDVILSKDQ